MRKFLLPVLLICICACPAFGCRATDDLEITMRLTKGERSRDSGARSTTITIAQDRIIYELAYSGMAGARQKPVRKEFKLSDEDKAKLKELAGARELPATETVDYPLPDSGVRRYFKISIELTLNGVPGNFTIQGPTNSVQVKEQELYQYSTALIEEVYRIIHKMDEDISYEALVN